MGKTSEIAQFLASRQAEGETDSQGHFTVGGEEALRKIAEFQLPFAGAWAVKIIQSIVAAGSNSPIRVDLTATEIRFYFVATAFTLDEFATAYYTPEPSPNRALRHLLSGLWAVGLKERWNFQIALPGQSETLIWDGERMFRMESQVARSGVCISIEPRQDNEGQSWAARVAQSGLRNAELLLTLSQRCYVCPLPLTVDSRRLDSLQRAEHHGWSVQTCPLTVGFAEACLPEFGVPPGTFEGLAKASHSHTVNIDDKSIGGWEHVGNKRLRELRPRDSTPLAFILTVNMSYSDGKERSWFPGQGPSTVYWILDGALVATEPLRSQSSHCSIGCFLSAQGLQTDFSTFQLLESAERKQRLNQAREALLEGLAPVGEEHFEEMLKDRKKFTRVMGVLFLLFGIGILLANPEMYFVTLIFLVYSSQLVFQKSGSAGVLARQTGHKLREFKEQIAREWRGASRGVSPRRRQDAGLRSRGPGQECESICHGKSRFRRVPGVDRG